MHTFSDNGFNSTFMARREPPCEKLIFREQTLEWRRASVNQIHDALTTTEELPENAAS